MSAVGPEPRSVGAFDAGVDLGGDVASAPMRGAMILPKEMRLGAGHALGSHSLARTIERAQWK